MLRTYRMSREGLRRRLWRTARSSFWITALLIAIALLLPLPGREAGLHRTTGWMLFYLVCVLLAATALSVRSARRSWGSYSLQMGEGSLTRRQRGMPEVSIQRASVIQIEEMPGRGLLVHTSDPERFAFVPLGMEDYAEVRVELAGWAPLVRVSNAATWRRHWVGFSTALGIVLWMLLTMFSTSPLFVVPSAFGISVFLLWAFVASQRSLHLDRRTKLSMWLVILPILGLTLRSTKLLSYFMLPH